MKRSSQTLRLRHSPWRVLFWEVLGTLGSRVLVQKQSVGTPEKHILSMDHFSSLSDCHRSEASLHHASHWLVNISSFQLFLFGNKTNTAQDKSHHPKTKGLCSASMQMISLHSYFSKGLTAIHSTLPIKFQEDFLSLISVKLIQCMALF